VAVTVVEAMAGAKEVGALVEGRVAPAASEAEGMVLPKRRQRRLAW
jgi:hypothetical protein